MAAAQRAFGEGWRRERDSNPRNPFRVQWFSRPPPSTARPSLRATDACRLEFIAFSRRQSQRFLDSTRTGTRNPLTTRPGNDIPVAIDELSGIAAVAPDVLVRPAEKTRALLRGRPGCDGDTRAGGERQVRRELIEHLVPTDADELESRQRKRLRARVGDARGLCLQINGE